ncbi:MAG: hypothetical protein RIT27_374 [Pseudomonadota bacterium]
MEKSWLKRYPQGIPAEINPNQYQSIAEVFEESCRQYANRPAFTNYGHTLSFKELQTKSLAFAAYLQQTLHLKHGDRIAFMMPNILQYPVALFGALSAGLVAVNVNPLYTSRELEHQLKDANVSAIVILANFAHVLEKTLDKVVVKHIIVTELADLHPTFKRWAINGVIKYFKRLIPSYHLPKAISFRTTLEQGAQLSFEKPLIKNTDLAFLQYTGGTTGVVKAAMLTQRNLIANMQQVSAWVGTKIELGQEIIITALPIYHIFCLTANCLCFMQFGALNVLITNPRDLNYFAKELNKYPFTVITGVNTLFNALLHHQAFQKLDFSSLKLTVGGGAAIQQAVAEHWREKTGCPILEGYGLTECSPVVCVNPFDITDFTNSIGLPISSTEISLRDENGEEISKEQAGELWVRGPQVMKGYWQRPTETTEILTVDGWLKTGDIATIDEKGFLRIVDRKKDMILVSGFNVYPNEIESVIAKHPAVLESACIGVPDEKSGEVVKLFVVLKPNMKAMVEELREFCRESLTGYKIPRFIEFRQDLPKSNVGKILRKELRNL